jgi:spermidine synthase
LRGDEAAASSDEALAGTHDDGVAAAMRPWELLGEARTPDGSLLALTRRGGEYVIHAGGKALMSSRMHGSEEALAEHGCHGLSARAAPAVLVGGLGMGFTLRAALERLPPDASVVVAELIPAVADWNRGPLAPLAGRPLQDPRVRLELCDVAALLRASPGAFDAVLLDVDNGPRAFTTEQNAGLYDDRGIAATHAALRPGGTLAVWSAWPDRRFEHRLRHGGFLVETRPVRARGRRGGRRHTLFLAHRA